VLSTIVSKGSEIAKCCLHCGPLFSKAHKLLKTLSLEELVTILLAWFKQAHTASASIDEPHLKEKAVHVAAHLGIVFGLQTVGSTVLRKETTWYTGLCWEKVPL
jgi:hypothetical protein